MIRYKSDLFGLRTLMTWNGSAAFRAIVPAFVSTGLVLVYATYWKSELDDLMDHPYVIGVFVAFFGFLLTTRLNFSYNRWWEAATMSHRMTSKLTDSAVCLASFHYQAQFWDPIKPITFGKAYASIANGTQSGTSHVSADAATGDEQDVVLVGSEPLEGDTLDNTQAGGGFFQWIQQNLFRNQSKTKNKKDENNDEPADAVAAATPRPANKRSQSAPTLLTKSFQPNRKQVITKSGKHEEVIFASQRGYSDGDNVNSPFRPSAFLEEAVHLYSLLNAVAMASLRHDVEGCPSPLAEYVPNRPFPPYNPDHFQHRHGHLRVPSEDDLADTKNGRGRWHEWWEETSDRFWNTLYFMAGLNRSPKQRTLYNAARPFHVLGGVSDDEALRLQLARGPMAQVALCQLWLKEFVSREYLNGSTGSVAPPIVGRVFHFITDGMAAYHQCRKVAYIPFPFPHEQLTSFFTLLVVFAFPVLYVGYVNTTALACIMNFVTLLCFQGIYEVARELSNPYHTVPNDLPLNRFHAQFNESLRALLTGYHPDWLSEREEQEKQKKLQEEENDEAVA